MLLCEIEFQDLAMSEKCTKGGLFFGFVSRDRMRHRVAARQHAFRTNQFLKLQRFVKILW